jgi:7-cyano-7-deazaguanine synthase
MGNNRAILLLSGGIDSTTLLAKLTSENYEVTAISFNYGQKHSVELNYARKNAKKYMVKHHLIIELDKALFASSALVNQELRIATYEDRQLPKGEVNAYVPFRNLMFISNALSLAESLKINQVHLAVNGDDSANFWDCTNDFIERITGVATLNSSIQIRTPFINLSKTEVLKLALRLDVDLNDTITCYQPNEVTECGACLSCMTKQNALKNV